MSSSRWATVQAAAPASSEATATSTAPTLVVSATRSAPPARSPIQPSSPAAAAVATVAARWTEMETWAIPLVGCGPTLPAGLVGHSARRAKAHRLWLLLGVADPRLPWSRGRPGTQREGTRARRGCPGGTVHLGRDRQRAGAPHTRPGLGGRRRRHGRVPPHASADRHRGRGATGRALPGGHTGRRRGHRDVRVPAPPTCRSSSDSAGGGHPPRQGALAARGPAYAWWVVLVVAELPQTWVGSPHAFPGSALRLPGGTGAAGRGGAGAAGGRGASGGASRPGAGDARRAGAPALAARDVRRGARAPARRFTRAAGPRRGVIREGVHDALVELREVVAVLRHDEDDYAAALPVLADVPALVEEARAAGGAVTLEDEVTAVDCPPAIDGSLTAVQEELPPPASTRPACRSGSRSPGARVIG